MDFGYHPSVHRQVRVHPKYRANVAVVANAYPDILKKYADHYRIRSLNLLIRPLIRSGVRTDFWGKNWDRMKPLLGARIPKKRIRGYLPYTKANQVYSSAKIVIALQNQLTQVTQRTYEILGSGGFVVTNDTPEIRRLFKPGRDLVVSRSPKETVKLVRYYLNHPGLRRRNREAGKKAVARHSYNARAQYMVHILREQRIL